jgi:glutathione S-transferase
MEVESALIQKIYITDANTPRPSVNPKVPRLYGHLLCPFVEKVRMALAARNVTYQSCEMDLEKKTPWHLAINGGLVPILELPDGTLINESKILLDFVEEAYGESGYSTLPRILSSELR